MNIVLFIISFIVMSCSFVIAKSDLSWGVYGLFIYGRYPYWFIVVMCIFGLFKELIKYRNDGRESRSGNLWWYVASFVVNVITFIIWFYFVGGSPVVVEG